jgi:hypothetical protein
MGPIKNIYQIGQTFISYSISAECRHTTVIPSNNKNCCKFKNKTSTHKSTFSNKNANLPTIIVITVFRCRAYIIWYHSLVRLLWMKKIEEKNTLASEWEKSFSRFDNNENLYQNRWLKMGRKFFSFHTFVIRYGYRFFFRWILHLRCPLYIVVTKDKN